MKLKLLAVVGLAAVGLAVPASGLVTAGDTGHTLVVNGTPYDSYQHSGAAIHWETPGGATTATFAERSQTWNSVTGNGSSKLPCPFGIHWISNENVLTLSHCLDDPYPTSTTGAPTSTSTTTTSVAPSTSSTTSTTSSTSTTTSTPSEPSTSAPTTTAPASTTTSPDPSTTTPPSSAPPSSPAPTTSSPASTTSVAVDQPPIPPTTTTVAPDQPIALPSTGSAGARMFVPWAILVLGLGGFLAVLARRRPV